MADTRQDSREDSGSANPLSAAVNSQAADRLKDEARAYLMAQAERALVGVGRKLGQTTVKLNDIADGKSPGFGKLALEGGRKLADGKGPLRSAVEVGGSRLKDSVKGALKNATGGRKKSGGGQKPTVILEYVDVGVPVRAAYDQWTQLQEFSTFAKGVKSATPAGDTDSDWQLKVFWSSRSWRAHVTEQVPDQRISWTSEGAKGSTKGVVTFHPLGDQLTRVLLIIEYYPKGLFEKTGNIWRAQGRRARLDLKHFARHITMRGEASDGWRAEIRDGEVVRSHDEVTAEEEDAEGAEGAENAEGAEDGDEVRGGDADREGDEAPYEDEVDADDADETDEPAETDEDDEPRADADEPHDDVQSADDEPADDEDDIDEDEPRAEDDPDEAPYEDEAEEDAPYEDEVEDEAEDEAPYEDDEEERYEKEGAEPEAEDEPRGEHASAGGRRSRR
ncbi:SRPBCC family protein [Streptomyces aureocirculatus]|uniref:SRPBCC family protein n=1 Tax=Streptomyces aureocirculatus TaxID=67275 RepID=UPI0004CC3576|nr:SRPBCC family protein [Streptomyces aureocirculatus]